MRAHSSNREGFALVAALGLLVALAAVGLSLSLQARARRLAATNAIEGTRARAAAAGGMEQARARLVRRLRLAAADSAGGAAVMTDPWRDLQTTLPETLSFGDARARVTLADANAAVNLNRADEDELRRLFVALRVDAGVADRLAQAIMDWRDNDDDRRPRGAEREQYARGGYDVLPANAPFRSVTELRAVFGMSDTLYSLVRPYLTVAGTGQVNLNAAPQPVLLSLSGVTEEVVGVLRRARGAGRPIRTLAELQLALSSNARDGMQESTLQLYTRAAFDTREVEVVSEGWTTGGMVHVRSTGLAVRAGRTAFLVARHAE